MSGDKSLGKEGGGRCVWGRFWGRVGLGGLGQGLQEVQIGQGMVEALGGEV